MSSREFSGYVCEMKFVQRTIHLLEEKNLFVNFHENLISGLLFKILRHTHN